MSRTLLFFGHMWQGGGPGSRLWPHPWPPHHHTLALAQSQAFSVILSESYDQIFAQLPPGKRARKRLQLRAAKHSVDTISDCPGHD